MSRSGPHVARPLDVNELVELRARQRTFSGAYGRTALSALGYSVVVLRLFEPEFNKIGLVFAIMGAGLFALSFARALHSNANFEVEDLRGDKDHAPSPGYSGGNSGVDSPSSEPDSTLGHEREVIGVGRVIRTAGTEGSRVFGRPFVTAGWLVLGMALVVGVTELALLALICGV